MGGAGMKFYRQISWTGGGVTKKQKLILRGRGLK
jgi:hypothetical protein